MTDVHWSELYYLPSGFNPRYGWCLRGKVNNLKGENGNKYSSRMDITLPEYSPGDVSFKLETEGVGEYNPRFCDWYKMVKVSDSRS